MKVTATEVLYCSISRFEYLAICDPPGTSGYTARIGLLLLDHD